MANQYCKITSWIEHNKKHGDPDYAQAILDLCLDTDLRPGKYQGLTFLYQTDSSIRKKFCTDKFSVNAHDLCKQFKRYILPDTFMSCEDFETKDVGNIMGHKYEVKSCTKDTVTFKDGMKIKAIEANSYEPLSNNLKHIIKIYYIVEGEPPSDENELYKFSHRKREKKGGSGGLIRGGTASEFNEVYESSNLGEHIKDIPHPNIYRNGHYAFHAVLHILSGKLLEHTGGQINENIKNLILAQWLVSSIPEGIIAYIYICLYVLYHADESIEFKGIVHSVLQNILTILTTGTRDHTVSTNYYAKLIEVSSEIGFNKSVYSEITDNKINDFITNISANKDTDIIDQFYQRIIQYPTIWSGTFIPTFYGPLANNIPKYGTYLGLWVLALFSPAQLEIEHIPKMELLDKTFIKLIRNDGGVDIANIHLFTQESLSNLMAGPPATATERSDNTFGDSVDLATGLAVKANTLGGSKYGGCGPSSPNLFD